MFFFITVCCDHSIFEIYPVLRSHSFFSNDTSFLVLKPQSLKKCYISTYSEISCVLDFKIKVAPPVGLGTVPHNEADLYQNYINIHATNPTAGYLYERSNFQLIKPTTVLTFPIWEGLGNIRPHTHCRLAAVEVGHDPKTLRYLRQMFYWVSCTETTFVE